MAADKVRESRRCCPQTCRFHLTLTLTLTPTPLRRVRVRVGARICATGARADFVNGLGPRLRMWQSGSGRRVLIPTRADGRRAPDRGLFSPQVEVWAFYRLDFVANSVANIIVNFVDRNGWIGPRRSRLEVAMFSHERLKVYDKALVSVAHLLFDKVYDGVRDQGADRSAKNVHTPGRAQARAPGNNPNHFAK